MIAVENTYRASEAAVVQLVLFAVAAGVSFETAVEDTSAAAGRHPVAEMFQSVAGSEAAAVEETFVAVVVDLVEVA